MKKILPSPLPAHSTTKTMKLLFGGIIVIQTASLTEVCSKLQAAFFTIVAHLQVINVSLHFKRLNN